MRACFWQKSFPLLRTLLLVASILVMAPFTTASAAVIDQFQGHGDHVWMNHEHGSDDGIVYVSVWVSRIGTPSKPETLFYFQSYKNVEPYYEGQSWGWGKIPNEDFVRNGNNGFTLTTDFSRLSGGEINGAATAIPTGPVNVQWSKGGPDYYETGMRAGTVVSEFFGITTRWVGISKYSSARVTGTVFGHPLEDYSGGYFGSENQVTITFEKNRTSP